MGGACSSSSKGAEQPALPPPSQKDAPGLFVERKQAAPLSTCQNHMQNFMTVVKVSVHATFQLADTFKDALPFPGAQGLALISQLAALCDTALANKDNLLGLRDRVAQLMDILIEKHTFETTSSQERKCSPKYKQLMTDLCDLLEDIKMQATAYSDRNFIIKLLMTSTDRDWHADKVQQLSELITDAHFSISVDTHTITTEIQSLMKQMREEIQQLTPYTDHSAGVRITVEALGGFDAVIADESKMQEVVHSLSVGHRVTLAVLKKHEEQIKAGFEAAAAERDTGVHRIIRHTDMRTFWKHFFKEKDKVSWDTWWGAFPDCMEDVIKDEALVAQIVARLEDEDAKAMFMAYVERGDPESISVTEVKLAFPRGCSLLDSVERATRTGCSSCRTPAKTDSATADKAAPPASKKGVRAVRSSLPLPDVRYMGREAEAGALEQLLIRQREQQPEKIEGSEGSCKVCKGGVCLVAGAGMGKSCLSLDVGWRLFKSGHCPGGAAFADLREARTTSDVLGRICDGLEISSPADDALVSIIGDLRSNAKDRGGPMLLILDNAEDAAQGPQPSEFKKLVTQVACEAVLIVTSRVHVAEDHLAQHSVSCLGMDTCVQLTMQTVLGMPANEAQQLVQLCRGVPLLVVLLSDALNSGRVGSVQELLESVEAADNTGNNTAADPLLALTLRLLNWRQRQQLGQLAVFPSGFDAQASAAVLGWDEGQAQAVLGILYRHNLILWSSSTQQYTLHMAVRAAAAHAAGDDAVRVSQERFVSHTFQQLGQWAALYASTSWQTALSVTREQAANVAAAFHLAGTLAEQQQGCHAGLNQGCWLSTLLSADIESIQKLLVSARLSSLWSELRSLEAYTRDAGAAQRASALLIRAVGYLGAGDGQAGVAAASEALELVEQPTFADHPLSTACKAALADGLRDQTKFDEAEPLYRAVSEARQRVHGAEHPKALSALSALAFDLDMQGKREEALPLKKAVLDGRLKVFGGEHPSTLLAMHNMANYLSSIGKYDEALPLEKAVLEGRRKGLGPEHPYTFSGVGNVALCLERMGRRDEAVPLKRAVIEGRIKILGPQAPATLMAYNNLANSFDALGQYDEALVLYKEAVDGRRQVLGPRNKLTLYSMSTMAACLQHAGRHAEAVPLFEAALEGCRKVHGADHKDTCTAEQALSDCLKEQGNALLTL